MNILNMRTKFFFLLALLSISSLVPGKEIISPGIKNILLKEELTLARASSCYFIIDLQARMIRLKARGKTLREWKIDGLRRWGDAVPLQAVTLMKKSALFAPERKKIKPGSNRQGETFELEVLELKDMPSSFSLFMNRGLHVYIRPKPDNFFSRALEVSRFLRWYTWIPLKNLWSEVKKKPLSALDIEVSSRKEAKSIYWALLEGFKGLIYAF